MSGRLTRSERRIAHEVLADPTLLAFGTVSDLAGRIGTSRPTIVRFATKLGFEGYTDLQRWVRSGVSDQLSSPGKRIRQPVTGEPQVRSNMERSLRESLAALDEVRLRELADPVAAATRVWILSGESSRAGAHALHSGLAMVRPGVHLVEEHDLGRDLSGAASGDAAVVFDFARYRKSAVEGAEALAELGVRVIAITDGPLSPLVPIAHAWCELSVPAIGPFDSSLPAVVAAELLVLEVVGNLGADAHAQIDRLERLWSTTGTFVDTDR